MIAKHCPRVVQTTDHFIEVTFSVEEAIRLRELLGSVAARRGSLMDKERMMLFNVLGSAIADSGVAKS